MNKKNLSLEAKSARAAYLREWYRRNPDKNREYMARYWEHKAKQIAVQREQNDECIRERELPVV